jgi:membrane-associated phospholipid phosphatase
MPVPRGPRFLPGRRLPPRNPFLAAIGDADQALLRFLRTRGHAEPVETIMRALGLSGEYGAVWIGIGGVGGLIDERRRSRWLVAGLTAPAAIVANYAVKRTIGRERPLIEEHPPLARAPSKLSFPSAHATSSVAAATALGRVQPRARLPLFALAAAICVGRPYLGMHYPSDALAGAVLGAAIGALIPGLGETGPPAEERLLDLGFDAHQAGSRNGEPDRDAAAQAVSRPRQGSG